MNQKSQLREQAETSAPSLETSAWLDRECLEVPTEPQQESVNVVGFRGAPVTYFVAEPRSPAPVPDLYSCLREVWRRRLSGTDGHVLHPMSGDSVLPTGMWITVRSRSHAGNPKCVCLELPWHLALHVASRLFAVEPDVLTDREVCAAVLEIGKEFSARILQQRDECMIEMGVSALVTGESLLMSAGTNAEKTAWALWCSQPLFAVLSTSG